MSFTDLLLSRRSVTANDLIEPGPNEDQLTTILQAAHRVPDHKKLGPWRFIVFQGDARRSFGNTLRDIFAQDNPDASEKLLEFEQQRFTRAPLVIAVISSPVEEPKAPEWEQVLSAGAACQNILLAATAMGFGSQWLTEWYAFHSKVDAALELKPSEKVAGYMYIGSFASPPTERNRPSLEERISFWK
ncbi:Putative NAD(P)H nitroreductase YdjA [Thalassocella blandensis]|nr:Putative NAD(P)H nitroreductase YdjA [Thalassocella blandensis]